MDVVDALLASGRRVLRVSGSVVNRALCAILISKGATHIKQEVGAVTGSLCHTAALPSVVAPFRLDCAVATSHFPHQPAARHAGHLGRP
jgi:hypothetical protein